MNFKGISDIELEEELARRKKDKNKPPKPIEQIKVDWLPVYRYVTKSVSEIAKTDEEDRSEPKDFEHWIYESVMVAIYGQDFWKWWNQQF